jgi:hypothetical protein
LNKAASSHGNEGVATSASEVKFEQPEFGNTEYGCAPAPIDPLPIDSPPHLSNERFGWGEGSGLEGLVRVVGIEPTLPCGNQILHPTMAFATFGNRRAGICHAR